MKPSTPPGSIVFAGPRPGAGSGQGKARRALGGGQGVLPAPKPPMGERNPGCHCRVGKVTVGHVERNMPEARGVTRVSPVPPPRGPLAPLRPGGASNASQNSGGGVI